MDNRPANIRKMVWVNLGVVALMFLLAAYAWVQLPPGSQVPVHWNAAGEVDRYGGKVEGLLLIPAVTLGLAGLFAAVPRIDPKGDNILRSWEAYRVVWATMLGVMLFVQAGIVATVLGVPLQIGSLIPAGVGVLFILIGNYMGKIRPNYMFGVRTPWTLASDLSWNKTHRLTGWLFVLLGFFMIVASLLGLGEIWVWGLLAGIVVVLVTVAVYSYVVWKDDPARR